MNNIEKYMLEASGPQLVMKPKINIEEYLFGGCQLFALALERKLGFEYKAAIWIDPDDNRHTFRHAWCVRKDGSWVDAAGTLSYTTLIEYYGKPPFLRELHLGKSAKDIHIMNKESVFSIWKKPVDYNNKYFMKIEQFIDNNKQFYEFDNGRLNKYN